MPYRKNRRPRRTLLKLNPRRRRRRRTYRRRRNPPVMRHALLMNPRRRRRVYRRRYNPAMVKRNPIRRRRRRNPNGAVRRLTSQRWLMDVAAIGMGMAAGYYTLPIAYKLTGSNPDFRPYLGAVNVAAGSLLIALAPRRAKMRKLVRETGAMIAGVGVYDLLASNIKALALPAIPESNALVNQIPGMAASYQVARRPVSRPASMMGASYAYGPVSYGASYEAPGGRTAGLGSDDPFNGIWQ